ncbi:class I SAM-dependent methyltransferase [Sphingobium sp. YR768]|uniref:class I SAM-dependent methyltransferase n=1 Tax=Sphingobium sp. YR768 TaxID=1884365 RepID=UPI0008C2C2A5|nr:class I SAM-dependent methyltransferase [Sphingobium sp. YR768]SEQ85116.1 Methyltransferase domain-containing protein [Sphingobium sp. YR768]
MADTDRDWRKWAETDPYYSVAAAPEFRRDRVDIDAFLYTGEAYIVQRLAMLEQQLGVIARRRALDFGCGVGRIALPMAMLFGEVVGLDVAPAMLAEAERLKQRQDAGNARFALSDDALSAADGHYDFVHSYIVFQHVPVARGLPLIGLLLDRVAVGGIASIHVALRRGDTPWRAAFYKARTRIPGFQKLVHWLRGKPSDEPMMQMNEYPVSAIFAMMQQRGFGQAIVDMERHGRFLTMHIAARRNGMQEQDG